MRKKKSNIQSLVKGFKVFNNFQTFVNWCCLNRKQKHSFINTVKNLQQRFEKMSVKKDFIHILTDFAIKLTIFARKTQKIGNLTLYVKKMTYSPNVSR